MTRMPCRFSLDQYTGSGLLILFSSGNCPSSGDGGGTKVYLPRTCVPSVKEVDETEEGSGKE